MMALLATIMVVSIALIIALAANGSGAISGLIFALAICIIMTWALIVSGVIIASGMALPHITIIAMIAGIRYFAACVLVIGEEWIGFAYLTLSDWFHNLS